MSTFVLDGRTIRDRFPGIGRYGFHLARSLAELHAGDRFRVVVDPRARNTRFDLARLAALPNVEIVPVRAAIFSWSEQRLAWNRRLTRDAAAWHSPFYAIPFALSLPTVVTLADLTPLVEPDEMPGFLKRVVYRLASSTAARRARAVITFSDASRVDLERVLRVPAEKITVVPLAADSAFQPASASAIERVRAALSLPPAYVLYLGTNKPHKNLPRLVEAWTQVRTEATLVIAGEWDPRYPRARELAQLGDAQERTLFRHAIAEADLPALLSGATAFVFPSVHEGFGLPPLEAMACGAPVACANASSLLEVVGAAAVTFDPLDVEDMARALSRVLEDRALRQELRRQGLERARQFSWERVARETMRVYHGIAPGAC